MFEMNCIDSNGEPITYFTQWDTNQTMIFEDTEFDVAPVFHFCNEKSERSLGVLSTLEGTTVTVDVPNSLLMEPYMIIVYIHLYKGKNSVDETRGKTVEIMQVPVRPKPRPTDLEFAHDKNVVYIEEIVEEVRELQLKVSESEQNVTQMKADVKSMYDSVNTSESNIKTIQSDVTTKYDSVNQSEQNVSTMKSQVEIMKSDVAGLKNDVLDVKNSIDTIYTNIQELEQNVTDMNANVNEKNAQVEQLHAQTSNIKGDIENIKSNIDTIYANIQSSEINIEQMESNIANIYDDLVERYTTSRKFYSGTEVPSVGTEGDVFLLWSNS